jgi:hypothetical protein
MPLKLENIDFRFENTRVKIIANKNHSQIKLAGLNIGPFEEGNEYEIYYWIATELVESGIAHLREEDIFDATKLYKVQWKERVQAAGQISELPEEFYPKLRRYLKNAKIQITKQPEPTKVQDFQKIKHLTNDIVNSRLKKIVALSSGPTQTDQIVKKLTTEEKLIYNQLAKIIHSWRNRILQHENEE